MLSLSRDYHSAHAVSYLCLTHRAFCGPVCCHRSRGERGVAVRAGGEVPAGHVEDVALLVQADGALGEIQEAIFEEKIFRIFFTQKKVFFLASQYKTGLYLDLLLENRI